MSLTNKMKTLLARVKEYLLEKEHHLRQLSYLASASLVLAIILAGILSLEPGWFSWAITVPAHLIIIITALARVKDLKDMRKRSQVRRIGLTMVGAGSAVFIMAPFVISKGNFPTWMTVLLVWGMALTWLTTPNHPPWWKYISGEYRDINP